MIAKFFIILAAAVAVQASGLIGVGAPLLAGGHLNTVSSQSSAINHIAPVAYAAPLAVGHGIRAGPLGLGLGAGVLGLGNGMGVGALGLGNGMGVGALGLGNGMGVGALGLGHGLAAGNVRADGIVGHGIVGSRYGGVIGHNAIIGVGHGGLGLGHGVGLGKAIW